MRIEFSIRHKVPMMFAVSFCAEDELDAALIHTGIFMESTIPMARIGSRHSVVLKYKERLLSHDTIILSYDEFYRLTYEDRVLRAAKKPRPTLEDVLYNPGAYVSIYGKGTPYPEGILAYHTEKRLMELRDNFTASYTDLWISKIINILRLQKINDIIGQ